MKVLIVEDEQRKSSMLEKYLEQEYQARVECVENEKEARDKLTGNSCFDTVLLDMTLPDMVHKTDYDSFGGINILSIMENECINIPTIVITSYWDFKQMLMREVKELYSARNELFRKEIDYSEIEPIDNLDYLDSRHKYMCYTYSHIYYGSIEFSYHNESWKYYLKEYVKELQNNGYIGL